MSYDLAQPMSKRVRTNKTDPDMWSPSNSAIYFISFAEDQTSHPQIKVHYSSWVTVPCLEELTFFRVYFLITAETITARIYLPRNNYRNLCTAITYNCGQTVSAPRGRRIRRRN